MLDNSLDTDESLVESAVDDQNFSPTFEGGGGEMRATVEGGGPMFDQCIRSYLSIHTKSVVMRTSSLSYPDLYLYYLYAFR